SQLKMLCLPIKQVAEAIPEGQYDVVISAGLFDYLEDPIARPLLGHLAALTVPGGVTAITNFHPEDPSRLVKEWLGDWRLVYRTDPQGVALFPDPARILTTRTNNKSLVCARIDPPRERSGFTPSRAESAAAADWARHPGSGEDKAAENGSGG